MKLLLSLLAISFSLHATTARIKEQREEQVPEYIESSHSYDLYSEQALTEYLPARLKELVMQVKKNGIETTAHNLVNDPDLDSYLFIIDTQKPYHMLAYSRTTAFNDKTPAELQALIFPTCKADACNIERTFVHIIATARKGTTYARYLWHADLEPYPQYQIAYVQLVTEHDKEYVLGAAIYRAWTAADHIVLPHRINTMLKRIKKEGLEPALDFIIKDPDPEMYYFVVSMKYPNRMLAQGAHSEYLTNTTPEEEQAFYPPCTQRLCNVRLLTNHLLDVALSKQGEGFQPYVLSKSDNIATTLKITYVKKFVYNKRKYFLASGHLTPVSAQDVQRMEDTVNDAIKRIRSIGLDNAVSELKKQNRPHSFLFINEAQPPYRYLLHANPEFNNFTADEVNQYYHKKFKQFPLNVIELVQKISNFAQQGGGLHALEYLVNPDEPQEGKSLEIAYTLPFEYNGKKYFISLGIPTEPTEASLKQMVSAP